MDLDDVAISHLQALLACCSRGNNSCSRPVGGSAGQVTTFVLLRTTRTQTIAVRLCSSAGSPSLRSRPRMHAHPRRTRSCLRLRFEPRNGAALGSAALTLREAEHCWVVGDATAVSCGLPPAWCLHTTTRRRGCFSGACPYLPDSTHHQLLLLRVVVLVRTRTRGGPAGRGVGLGGWARLLSP